MTTAFVVSGIPPHRVITGETDGFALYMGTAARVLWWIHLAWATIGFIRLYIVLDRRPQEARLLQDLIVTAVYLGVTLSIVGFVFGAPIGTLVATSGVVAIILGLALQNTLGDLFSGIALTLGRPFSIGDWIQLADGTEGHVVQNNWRSTQVLTPANNLVVLPNSTLAKVGLTNLTKPDESHLVILPIRVSSDSRPAEVEAILKSALQTCQCIVSHRLRLSHSRASTRSQSMWSSSFGSRPRQPGRRRATRLSIRSISAVQLTACHWRCPHKVILGS